MAVPVSASGIRTPGSWPHAPLIRGTLSPAPGAELAMRSLSCIVPSPSGVPLPALAGSPGLALGESFRCLLHPPPLSHGFK